MPATDTLTKYRETSAAPLPQDYQRWHLYGAGLENVGKNGEPETVSLPDPTPDQILVRHDACGICFSDIKIINLGPNHPRLQGRDLHANPVVMGHEVALTVVKPGANYIEKFPVGSRFIVQADVYYKGVNLAYGYALTGGMSQYGLIGPEVLEGDEGCYLLPIEDATGYAEAALVEPWACVEAAYHWTERFDSPRDGDLTFADTPSAEQFEAATAALPKAATVHLDFTKPLERPVKVDVGRVHYDGWMFVGPERNGRTEIKAGGAAWFVGAGGPMGQMHAQRALQLPEPPRLLLCTDRHDTRLAALKERFGPLAEERGVQLVLWNVRAQGNPDFAALAPNGFDDIVVMVPSIEAIEEGFPYLAQNGVMNVFAGVARGTTATLDMNAVAFKNARIVGTSGSTIEDMRLTRDKMEADALDTGASVAAIGGLEAFCDGLDAVKNSRFPGKTVIFPQIKNLPLTALPDLNSVRPNIYALLKDGTYWTHEAEAELLKEAL